MQGTHESVDGIAGTRESWLDQQVGLEVWARTLSDEDDRTGQALDERYSGLQDGCFPERCNPETPPVSELELVGSPYDSVPAATH